MQIVHLHASGDSSWEAHFFPKKSLGGIEFFFLCIFSMEMFSDNRLIWKFSDW